MATAALIVSVLALIVSGVAAWYTRTQAKATEEAVRLERQKQAETRPILETGLAGCGTSGSDPYNARVGIRVRNNGPVPGTNLTLLLPEGFSRRLVRYGSLDTGCENLREHSFRLPAKIEVKKSLQNLEYEILYDHPNGRRHFVTSYKQGNITQREISDSEKQELLKPFEGDA